MSAKAGENLEWALRYPPDLSAKAVLAALATESTGENVTISTQKLSEKLGAPKRTCEDAVRRLITAGAITGKRGVYRLQVQRSQTTVYRGNKLKNKTVKTKTATIDNAPLWWSTLTSLSIDARKGHVGVTAGDLPRIRKWVEDKGLTDDEAELAADKLASRWPIRNQKVIFRIFYTYCRYQLKEREHRNGKGSFRNIGKRVNTRRVPAGGTGDPFANFTTAGDG